MIKEAIASLSPVPLTKRLTISFASSLFGGLEEDRLHFRLLRKLWFGSVQPSPATLIRVAFNCSIPVSY
jgi:hypothetical protein